MFRIEFGAHFEPALGCRVGDELDDCPITAQRFAAPIDGDEGKEPVLDFVPLAGPRWQMADRDRKLEFISQFLQFDFPQPDAVAVGTAAIGRHHKSLGLGIALLTHGLPPSADGVDRKRGGVVVGSHAHPAGVVMNIVNPVRHGPLQFGINEVMDIDQLRLALGAPLPTVVLEIAHQFLLFRIDRDDRLVRGQEPLGLVVDVVELRVTIDVSTAFFDFAVGLKTVARAPCRSSPTTEAETLCPFSANALTSFRRLSDVHNKDCMGSPRVEGSTSAFRSLSGLGSSMTLRLRPPPGLRMRPAGADTPARMSAIPRLIVERAKPLIRDSALTPP